MTRSRLDLSGLEDTPPSKDPAVLREISDNAGFPSRPAAPPIAVSPRASSHPVQTPSPAASMAFQRPARATRNRQVPMNVRVDPETADRMYAMRDADPSGKRTLADVIEEAVALLYDREQHGRG